MKTTFTIAILLINNLFVFSQISMGGTPYFYNELKSNGGNFLKSNSTVKIPTLNYRLDSLGTIKNKFKNNLKEFIFAKSINVNISTANNGVWIDVPSVGKIWQLKIRSEKALSLSVFLDQFYLPDGAKFFIYNIENNSILGAFTNQNNKPFKSLSVSPVKGEYIILELQIPYHVGDNFQLHISKIYHDFVGILDNEKNKDGIFGTVGDCNIDINCFEQEKWNIEKRSVSRMIFPNDDYLIAGSGVLINNTENDGTPYFLTANHLIDVNLAAQKTLFYFNYEKPLCKYMNGISIDGGTTQSISGATLIATSNEVDFSLLELSSTPPAIFSPYYAGWDITNTPPENVTGIHHPRGSAKKISKDNDKLFYSEQNSKDIDINFSTNSHWLIEDWELGVTEGGSSGSPLFNNNKKLVGILSGGLANCSYLKEDLYTRFDMAWDYFPEETAQLKKWLNPNSKNITQLEGYDPYVEEAPYAHFFNFNYFDEWQEYNIGNNNLLSEKFNIKGQLEGIYLMPSNVKPLTDNDNRITIKIWEGNKYPETILYSQDISLAFFEKNKETLIYLDEIIDITGTVFIGFEAQDNTFRVYKIKKENQEENSAFAYYYDEWAYLSDIENSPTSLSLGIGLLVKAHNLKNYKTKNSKANIYPIPVKEELNIDFTEKFPDFVEISLYAPLGVALISNYNITPQLIAINNIYKYVLNLNNYKNGVYFLKLCVDDTIISKKIIVN